MIQIDTKTDSLKLFNMNGKTVPKQGIAESSLLFEGNCGTTFSDEVVLSKPTIPPIKMTPFPAGSGEMITNRETDTLRLYNNPRTIMVTEYYSNGKPHYVKDFYDGVLIKQTECMGDGTIITVDEYIDGKLRRHTDNYPGSGEPCGIEEYNEKGKLIRYYEYAPSKVLIDYKEFPDE